jgi:hypothetical protein
MANRVRPSAVEHDNESAQLYPRRVEARFYVISTTRSGSDMKRASKSGSMESRHISTRYADNPLESALGFLPGDIILFGSTGDLFSNVGRWLMKGKHEAPTYAVHTGQFIDPNRVLEMEAVTRVATIDEVLKRRYWQGPFRAMLPPPAWVQIHNALNRRFLGHPRYRHVWQGLWKARGFEVWRYRTLTEEQREALTREALTYLNVRFGYLKFLTHALDNVLCKLLRRDVFLFRHTDPEHHHPVCSGITASVYDRVLRYRFGVDPECADPDQIYDWVHSHSGEWAQVFRLEPKPAYPQVGKAGRTLRSAGRLTGPCLAHKRR